MGRGGSGWLRREEVRGRFIAQEMQRTSYMLEREGSRNTQTELQ